MRSLSLIMIDLKLSLKQLKPIHKGFLISGTIAAAVFGYNYLIAARGDCGVVRYFEYIAGIAGLSIWFCCTIIGLIFLKKGGRKTWLAYVGTFIIVITNSLITLASSALIYSFLENNFYLTSTEHLIELVTQKDDRLAALELGERNDKKAIPLLCRIAQDEGKDINLRFNAMFSLRMIGSSLSRDDPHYEYILTCVLKILDNQRLRAESAKTLGIMGDERAVMPLLNILQQEENEFVKNDIIRALGLIGDKRAYMLLQRLLSENENSGYLFRYVIEEALAKIEAGLNNE